MNEADSYCVALFHTVSHVMKAEKILKAAGIPYKIVPVPKHISPDCGVCLRFLEKEEKTIREAIEPHLHISDIRKLPPR